MAARKSSLRVYLAKKLIFQPISTTKHLTNTLRTLRNQPINPLNQKKSKPLNQIGKNIASLIYV
jgi:hypothetical protein